MNTNILWVIFYALLWGFTPVWLAATVNLSFVAIGFSIRKVVNDE